MLKLVTEAVEREWPTLEVDEPEVEKDERCPLLLRGRDPMVHVPGIRYQRCGGGRRVIRKQRGAN